MKDEKELIIPLKRMGKRNRLGVIATTPGVTNSRAEFGTHFSTLFAFLLVSIASSTVTSMALVLFIFWIAKG